MVQLILAASGYVLAEAETIEELSIDTSMNIESLHKHLETGQTIATTLLVVKKEE